MLSKQITNYKHRPLNYTSYPLTHILITTLGEGTAFYQIMKKKPHSHSNHQTLNSSEVGEEAISTTTAKENSQKTTTTTKFRVSIHVCTSISLELGL